MVSRRCRERGASRLAHSPIGRLWRTLREPRRVTGAMVLTYVVLGACALALILITDRPDLSEHLVEMVTAGFMAVASVLGTVGAWRGAYWLERPATVAAGVAVPLIILSAITGLDPLSAPDKYHVIWLLVSLGVPAELVFYKRSVRLKWGAYAVGHGPPTATQVAVARALPSRGSPRVHRSTDPPM